jgi:hypothetical protein
MAWVRLEGKHPIKCATSCAVLRNFLRTRLQATAGLALSDIGGRFRKISAQLLAHHGDEASSPTLISKVVLDVGADAELTYVPTQD